MPDWYHQEPPLLRGDSLYIEGFFRLSSCRSLTGGIGAIPWDKAVWYARRAGLSLEMQDVFADVVLRLDVAFREWAEERAKSEARAQSPARGGRVRSPRR